MTQFKDDVFEKKYSEGHLTTDWKVTFWTEKALFLDWNGTSLDWEGTFLDWEGNIGDN